MLTHAVNLGKGRALKYGINYYLNHLQDQFSGAEGIITVDADGQHLAEDVAKIDDSLRAAAGGRAVLALGCRDFDGSEAPFKSRIGNKITRSVFRLLFGKRIRDTQTGLRGFTNNILPELLGLAGERFEYETNVLIACTKKKIPVVQTGIHTIYENKNAQTHFRPFEDSLKIYGLLMGEFVRYTLSSFTACLLDCGIFWLLCGALSGMEAAPRIFAATAAARLVSSVYNYAMNKKVVFRDGNHTRRTLLQYYALCVCIMALSGLGVSALYAVAGGCEVLLKCIVDGALFFAGYKIQQKYIFTGRVET